MLPPAITRALRLPLLEPEMFCPTKWETADAKAWFGNNLLRFSAENFPEPTFTERFYRRLSMTFGHIAHYNRAGFWAHFFASQTGRVAFLEQTLGHPCYGDPDFTYNDVERAVILRLRAAGVLGWHRRALTKAIEASERAEFGRLTAKFGTIEPDRNPLIPEIGSAPTIQADLFA